MLKLITLAEKLKTRIAQIEQTNIHEIESEEAANQFAAEMQEVYSEFGKYIRKLVEITSRYKERKEPLSAEIHARLEGLACLKRRCTSQKKFA